MVAIVQATIAQVARVEPPLKRVIFLVGALNTMGGARDAANALLAMKAGEIYMPLIIILLLRLMMLVFGKSTRIIGHPAAVDRHHAI